jgi:hypothetical protein
VEVVLILYLVLVHLLQMQPVLVSEVLEQTHWRPQVDLPRL